MAQAFAKEKVKHQHNQTAHVYNQAVVNSLSHPPLGYLVNSHQTVEDWRFRKDLKTYEPLIYGLEHAYSNSLFCCGGSVQTSDMDTFLLKIKQSNFDSWKEFSLGDISADELLPHCNPAPFGDLMEMKTVLDANVRSAYEIETARFQVVNQGKQFCIFPAYNTIYEHIAKELTPGRRFKMDQNKLNVYEKGGFFKPHVDSPSCANMIATLVICLPSPHKGGELVVSHDGLQHVFDFSQESGDASKIQWAAFYSDCVHEVKPVLEGHRVTITYNITLHEHSLKMAYYERKNYSDSLGKPVDAKDRFEVSPRCSSRSLTRVDSALRSLQQLPDSPSRVGFLLKHKYTTSGLQPQLLKGEDKELFDYLVAKEWKSKLMSILSRFQTDMVFVNDEDMDYEETHKIYEFKPVDSESPERSASRSTYDALHALRIKIRPWRVGIPFVEIYRKADDTKLVFNKKGRDSWVGNEIHPVEVDKLYLESAAIVELG